MIHRLLTLLALLSLPVVLGGASCQTTGTTVSAANVALCDDPRTPAPADGIMRVIFPDPAQDSPLTVLQVRESNAARDAVCGPLTDEEIDYLLSRLPEVG